MEFYFGRFIYLILDSFGGFMVFTSSLSKKIIIFLLSLSLLFNPVYANTSQNIGGWSVTSNVVNGIGKRITASKDIFLNGVSRTATSVSNITPNPSNVAKFLAKAGGLSIAIDALDYLLDGVDYVMDPANNTITYKKVIKDVFNDGTLSTSSQYKCHYGGEIADTVTTCGQSYIANCLTSSGCSINKVRSCHYTNNAYCVFERTSGGTTNFQVATRVNRVSTFPEAETEEKSIPLAEIGSRVIDKAEKDVKAGSISPAVTLARTIAQDLINEAEKDDTKARPIVNDLVKNQVIPTDETAVGTINPPTTGEGEVSPIPPSNISLDFPVFCGWAPTICNASQVVLDAPAKIAEYIEAVKAEYAKEHELTKDTELELPEVEEKDIDSEISFNGMCPQPEVVHIRFFGLNERLEFKYDSICELAEFIKPVVISISAFSSALIVAGIRNDGD